ncbi:MAG: HEAT repeat domain-containing protein [Deltaproteobacteria bacterium]|nr:HEAT repeat domain-containing protein [Deltaproteobacteria bacterium]
MASKWYKLRRFVARTFKSGEPSPEQVQGEEVVVSERRRRHLLSQIAGLDDELRRIQRSIGPATVYDESPVSPTLARSVVRARDIRYKASLLAVELRRGRSDEVRDTPRQPIAPREIIETARDLLQYNGLEELAPREIVEQAVGHLLEGSTEERRDSIGLLRALHSEAVVPVLKAALTFDDDWIRVECNGALADFGEQRAVAELMDLLESQNPRLRIAAMRGLNGLNVQGALLSCVRSLADQHPEVRRMAVTFLGWHRSPQTIGALAVLLKDEKTAVRVAAAEALGQIESDKTIFPLIRALGDGKSEVRRAAKQVLEQALAGSVDIDPDADFSEIWPRIDALIAWWAESRANGQPWTLQDRIDISLDESTLVGREVVPLFARRALAGQDSSTRAHVGGR